MAGTQRFRNGQVFRKLDLAVTDDHNARNEDRFALWRFRCCRRSLLSRSGALGIEWKRKNSLRLCRANCGERQSNRIILKMGL